MAAPLEFFTVADASVCAIAGPVRPTRTVKIAMVTRHDRVAIFLMTAPYGVGGASGAPIVVDLFSGSTTMGKIQ
jgi:hypothetical protein